METSAITTKNGNKPRLGGLKARLWRGIFFRHASAAIAKNPNINWDGVANALRGKIQPRFDIKTGDLYPYKFTPMWVGIVFVNPKKWFDPMRPFGDVGLDSREGPILSVKTPQMAAHLLKKQDQGVLYMRRYHHSSGRRISWGTFYDLGWREVSTHCITPDREAIMEIAERVVELAQIFPNWSATVLAAYAFDYEPTERLRPLMGQPAVETGSGDMREIAILPKGVKWLQPLDNKALLRVGRNLSVCLGQYYTIAPAGADETREKFAVRVNGSGQMDLCLRTDSYGNVREIRRHGNSLPDQTDVDQVEKIVLPTLGGQGISLDHGVTGTPQVAQSRFWDTISSWNGPLEALADWLGDQKIKADAVFDIMEDVIQSHGIDAVEFFGDFVKSRLLPEQLDFFTFACTWGGDHQHDADRITVRCAETCVANGGGTTGAHQVALARWGQAPVQSDKLDIPASCWMIEAAEYSPRVNTWGIVRERDLKTAQRVYKSRIPLQRAWDFHTDRLNPIPSRFIMQWLCDCYGRSTVQKHAQRMLAQL